MYLNKDCFYYIAIIADYDTTVSMLCALPLKNIWQDKWQFLYPHKTYFNFFTLRENYLLKEHTYYLQYINRIIDLVINAMLIKRPMFDEVQVDLIYLLPDVSIEYLSVNIDKLFMVFKSNNNYKYDFFYQDDMKINCHRKLKEDWQINYNWDYIIIDVSQLNFNKNQGVHHQFYNKYNINDLEID